MFNKNKISIRNSIYSALIFLVLLVPSYAQAQLVEDFYVPLPEDAALDFFDDIGTNGDPVAPLITRTDIVIREVGTIIISDPVFDGYEDEYVVGPFAETTEFWGDGICVNGFKPTITACTVDSDDTFDVGEVVIFDASEVSASDYFLSNELINLTRSAFPTGTGTFLAGAFELFPTAQWGTTYVVPIGENTANSGSMFEQVAVTIMAREDGTIVNFDPDGTGPAAVLTATLNRGESVEYGIGTDPDTGQVLAINEGATIVTTAPVQANVLTGDIGSTFETRFYTLFPDALLSNEYYEAVGSTETDTPASVFLFNPTANAINVEYFDNTDPIANPTTVTIAAGASVNVVMPTGTTGSANGLTGLRFASTGGEVFSAYTVVDDEVAGVGNSGQIHDWGHVTTPLRLMGDTIRVGFAPGSNPDVASTLNASPIWVIADSPGEDSTKEIEICVDSQGNGTDAGNPVLIDPATGLEYDYSVIVNPLDSSRLYNSGPENLTSPTDGEDQTGMLAFACNTASDPDVADVTQVIIAAAWGQDPNRTGTGDQGFDVGTTIRTGSNDRLFIGDTVFLDFNGNGIKELDEVGLANVDVTITSPNPLVDVNPDPLVFANTFTVQTDSDGLYLFTSLLSGEDYTVTVTPPTDFSPVSDPDGLLDNTTSLTLNTSTLEQDFGYSNTVVGDTLFFDNNGDGIQDVGELGIPNVEVQLCRNEAVPALSFVESFDADAVPNTDTPFGVFGFTENDNDGSNFLQDGNIFIDTAPDPADNALRFADTDGGPITGEGVTSQSLNLSNVVGNATLTIDWDSIGGAGHEASDIVRVFVSEDGGTNFDEIARFIAVPAASTSTVTITGGARDIEQVTGTENLSGVTVIPFDPQLTSDGSNVQIQFTVEQYAGGGEFLDFNQISLTGTVPGTQEVCLTTTTDANGFYVFTGIVDDTYEVRVDPNGTTLPANIIQTAAPAGEALDNTSEVVVTGGVGSLDEDFGYQLPTISGSVTEDTTGDGLGDTPVPGAIIQLYSDTNGDGLPDVLIDTTTTAADGTYVFINPPQLGDLVLVEIDPAGFSSVSDAQIDDGDDINNVNTNDNIIPVNIVTGEDAGNDFVDIRPGSIAGTVWLDEDLDGILDIEETGITGVRVNLLNPDSSPVLDASGNPVFVVTDANGNYSFEGIVAGDYLVDVVDADIPAGLTNTAGIGGVDPKPVTVSTGEQVTDVDFGYIPGTTPGEPNLGAIGDRVWADANGNGIQDPGESGIEGVNLQLTLPSGGVFGTTVTTNANGDYLFTGVPFADDYIVIIVAGQDGTGGPLEGLAPTVGPQSEGGFVGNPVSLSPTLSVVTDIDFGFDGLGGANVFNTIIDTVFFDQNGDGVQNNDDPGIANVTVDILDANGDVVATTVSDENGVVTFTGLDDGAYTLVVTDNNNELNGLNGTTGESLVGENGVSEPISVSGGSSADGNDSFGYNNPGLISGTIYVDDGPAPNSDQDAGEAGLEGVTVELRDGNDELIAAVTTGPDGSYEFDGLVPDTYSITVIPVGGSQTEDPDGTPNNTTSIILGVGDSSVGNDFGYTDVDDVFDLSGVVFLDTDADGVEEAGEPGIPGVTLDLLEIVSVADIINGMFDVNGDGVITADDDGTLDDGTLEVTIIDGMVDINDDGIIDEDDNGTFDGRDILAGMVNLAQAGTATQSSQLGGLNAGLANDGLLNDQFSHTIQNSTTLDNDWWQIDLGSVQSIGDVTIFNRDNSTCCQDRLGNTAVLVSDIPFPGEPSTGAAIAGSNTAANFTDAQAIANAVMVIPAPVNGTGTGDVTLSFNGVSGRFIRLQKTGVDNGTNQPNVINISEVKVTSVSSLAVDITTVDIINGMYDVNDDGVISAADDGTLAGVNIIDGMVDIDGDNNIDEDDNGTFDGRDILVGMVNLAQAGTATQSSTLGGLVPSFANDGNPGNDRDTQIAHTNGGTNEWWQVDLGSVQPIGDVTIFNRDDCCADRLGNTVVLVSDIPFPVVLPNASAANFAAAQAIADAEQPILETEDGPVTGDVTLNFNGVLGRFIRLQKTNVDNITNVINIAEVKVTPAFIGGAPNPGPITITELGTVTTDDVGFYEFTGLPAGDYRVSVTDEAAQLTGFDITSGLDQLDRTIVDADITDVDFGYIREENTGSISGEVWIDEGVDNDDNPLTPAVFNDVPDDSEVNLSNVRVYLCNAPTVDAPDGTLLFSRFDTPITPTISTVDNIDASGSTLSTGVPTTRTDFSLLSGDSNGANFGYIYTGFIEIPVAGSYEFSTTSDDGSTLSIDGAVVVDNDFLQGATTRSGTVVLQAGFHAIEVRFFQGIGGRFFSAAFTPPGGVSQDLNTASFSTVPDACNLSHPNFIAQTTTDTNGEYVFTDLPPNQYVIDTEPADIPSGLDLSVDPATVSLSEGEDVSDVDVGYVPGTTTGGDPTGVLSGFVWTDVNSNGIFDVNEAPIAGVEILVTDINNPIPTGSVDGGGNPIFQFGTVASAITNADGSYLITGLNTTTAVSGGSLVGLVDGLIVSYSDPTIPANLNSTQPTNLPLGDDNYQPVDLLSDADNNISFLDFGFAPNPDANLGSISGTIYLDDNQDDDYQPAADGELEGVTVLLIDNDTGTVISSAPTDANGFYVFDGLQDGNYRVEISDINNDTQDLNPNDETLGANLVISGGNNITDQDAGFFNDEDNLASIGNRFFFDSNANGLLDEGERGIEGVVVQCWLDVDANETPNDPAVRVIGDPITPVRTVGDGLPEPGVDNLIRTVTTDSNGEYNCTSLPKGQYIVVVADAAGFDELEDGTQTTGSIADNAAKPWVYTTLLTADEEPNFTADFGVAGSNTLSGIIAVEDPTLSEPSQADGEDVIAGQLDGVPSARIGDNVSPDSAPLEPVTVVLLIEQADGSFVELATTTTDPATGAYSFENLPDGNYRVEVLTNGSSIDGFGQTGDPDLSRTIDPANPENVFGTAGNVCDSDTSSLCDDTASVTLGGASPTALPEQIDFTYQRNFTTTPVTMNFFHATRDGSAVNFVWETSNEVGNAGFQIFARNADDWVLITPGIVPNAEGDSLAVKRYEFRAENVTAKWFALIDVSVDEKAKPHGPFEIGKEYGQELIDIESFDWSKVQLETPSVIDFSKSVSERLRGLEMDAEERAASQ